MTVSAAVVHRSFSGRLAVAATTLWLPLMLLAVIPILLSSSSVLGRVVGWYALTFAGFALARIAAAQVLRWCRRSEMVHTVAFVDLAKRGDAPASVEIVPHEAELLFGQSVPTSYHRLLTGWNRIVKQAEDLILAIVALILVAPMMSVVAVLIKLDSKGPVLFRQQRVGFNNNVITVYKFRTMMHQLDAPADVPQAQRADRRVTRLGRFLRRTGLDELPQLFNVLKGEISLVGPRPHALAHNDMYAALIDNYLSRHQVQPGITGWAQVNSLRGETDTLDRMQRRVQYDLAYINNWSLFLDLKIMLMTVLLPVYRRSDVYAKPTAGASHNGTGAYDSTPHRSDAQPTPASKAPTAHM